ncbi:MAG: BNR-4 repeat-containing protein, partial [Solirubrobacteraceae bacterium]
MRFKRILIGVGLGLALLAVTAAPARVRSATVGEDRRVALLASVPIDTWSGGSWSWFSDPRAVHVVGPQDKTFVGWIDASGNVTVGAYDDNFGAMRSRVIGHLYHDDHGSPAILVEPDKRLTVFWSAHNGSTMNFRSTLRPEDVNAWGPIDHVPARIPGSEGFTYQNPVLVPAERNRLYLFWRGADWSQDFATRTVGGRWSPARRLISARRARPYLKVDSDGSGAIALAFTNGHPRDALTSVYYAAYRNGSLWSASGRWIERLSSAPIAPRQADLVY